MKPLIVLLSVFVVSLFATYLFNGRYEWTWSARTAMSVMLVFTAVAHVAFTKGMAMMLPAFVPYKTAFIYLTGVIEIAAAVGLCMPGVRTITMWLLIAFFICLLPANVYAAIKHIDYQKGTFDGYGPRYLWFRVPLQIFFIAWTYYSSINH